MLPTVFADTAKKWQLLAHFLHHNRSNQLLYMCVGAHTGSLPKGIRPMVAATIWCLLLLLIPALLLLLLLPLLPPNAGLLPM
jgi:hypothetical protein